MGEIEDIVLRHDTRGITCVRPVLSPTYCDDAAAWLETRLDRVLILTGFYVAGTAETDGPPAALALAAALGSLGAACTIVTDRYCLPILQAALAAPDLAHPVVGAPFLPPGLVEFPILDASASATIAADLIDRMRPTLVIAVERCGLTRAGAYLNMRGEDIAPFTARLDPLVCAVPSIGIGDGGNEIGMGSVAGALVDAGIITTPCATATDRLVVGAVSNWAAYGVLAALSLRAGRVLLPPPEWEHGALRLLVAAGAVEGVTHRREAAVDGFPAAVGAEIVGALHAHLVEHGLSPHSAYKG